VISYVASDEVYLYSCDNSLEMNLPKKEWKFISEAGSWRSQETFNPEYLVEVVSQFVEKFGKPELCFPWIELLGRYGPNSPEWENFQEDFGLEEDSEELKLFNQAQLSETYIDNATAKYPKGSLFTIRPYESGDYLLPPNCQFSRLRRYFKELENQGWIVIDYITDQGFAFDQLEEDREESEFEGVAPALVSPLESVFQSYTPSGGLYEWIAVIDLGDGDIEDLKCASIFSLKVEIRHQDQLTILAD